jgi:hypothetical protein
MRTIDIHSGDPCDVPRYIARNPYAWPGGYDIAGVADDGELICAQCIRSEYKLIMSATRYQRNDGWRIIGYQTSDWMENGETCAHCGRLLDPYQD